MLLVVSVNSVSYLSCLVILDVFDQFWPLKKTAVAAPAEHAQLLPSSRITKISHSLIRREEESLLVENNIINVSFAMLWGQIGKESKKFLKDFQTYISYEFNDIPVGEYAFRAIYWSNLKHFVTSYKCHMGFVSFLLQSTLNRLLA